MKLTRFRALLPQRKLVSRETSTMIRILAAAILAALLSCALSSHARADYTLATIGMDRTVTTATPVCIMSGPTCKIQLGIANLDTGGWSNAVNGVLTLGQPGSSPGSILFAGSISGYTTLTAPATGGGTMTLPSGAGTLATTIGNTQVAASTYGVDETGVVPSDVALQSAVDALPPEGGTINFKCGAVVKLANAVNVGNGTTSTPSTRMGVRFMSQCPIMGYALTPYAGWPSGQKYGLRFTWAGGAAGIMFQLNGPFEGWGFDNVIFDGGGVAATAIYNISAGSGVNGALAFVGFTGKNYRSETIANFNIGGVYHTDALRNRFASVTVGLLSGATGIDLNGVSSGQSNTDFNAFGDVHCVDTTTAAGTCVRFAVSDSNRIDNLMCTLSNAASKCVTYDFSVNNNFPLNNTIYNADWGSTATSPVTVVGSPASVNATNSIAYVSGANGSVPVLNLQGVYMNDGRFQSYGGWFNAYGLIAKAGGVIGANTDPSFNKFLANGSAEQTNYFIGAGFFSRYTASNASGGPGAPITWNEYERVFGDGHVRYLQALESNGDFYVNANQYIAPGSVVGANWTAPGNFIGNGIAEHTNYYAGAVGYFSKYVGYNAAGPGAPATMTEYERVVDGGLVEFFKPLTLDSDLNIGGNSVMNNGRFFGVNLNTTGSVYTGNGIAAMTNYFTSAGYFSHYVGFNAGTGGEAASLTEYQRVGSDRAVTFMGAMQFSAYGAGVLTTDSSGNVSAVVGVSCSGPPSGAFAVTNGVVTRC